MTRGVWPWQGLEAPLPCPLLKTSHNQDPDCPARDDKEWGWFLVFSHVDNTPIRPDTITRVFRNKAKEVGLNELTFHGLRHTHAVLMLAANVHPKIVSERLGHSAASITLDLHSSVSETQLCKPSSWLAQGSLASKIEREG